MVTSAAIAAAMVVNFILVRFALQPLHALEATVARVASGHFEARVPSSPFADRDMTRVAAMVNGLLDTVTDDRTRLRLLASRVIDAGDRQRAEVAHELHDSTAQVLAGLAMQISAEANKEPDPSRAGRLASVRETLAIVTEGVRQMAQEMHPRVLEDLGLPAALRELARTITAGHNVDVSVTVGPMLPEIPVATASGLYRTAEEALSNAIRHGDPSHIDVRLFTDDDTLVVEVVDDGEGFAVEQFRDSGRGTGLFAMRERLSLLDGTCHIRSVRGEGTRVIARVPTARPVMSTSARSQR
jgi:signal transduction histidine kinase